MKITRTASEVLKQNVRREAANVGCDICPCCGESISSLDAIKSGYGLSRGISHIVSMEPRCFRCATTDKYHCNRCGAEWESDPY